MTAKRPNCYACRHFFVTWDAQWPRGCRVFGFRTRGLPAADVLASSGEECQAFEERVNGPGSQSGRRRLRADSWEGPSERARR